MNKNNFLGAVVYSSVNPEKISLTLKGLIPLVVALLPMFGVVNIGESDLVALVNAVVVAISGAVTLYGVIRKIVNKFAK